MYKETKIMVKILKLLASFIGGLVLIIIVFLIYATITDYTPEEKTLVDVESSDTGTAVGNELSLLSWNIGYAGLGSGETFFMDGGVGVLPNEEDVNSNFEAIKSFINSQNADIYLLQEVDINSTRTNGLNEYEEIKNLKREYDSTFAYNYKVSYVPYPWPMLGHMESGLATLSKFDVKSSTRYQFPGNYSWPKKLGFLDRCFVEHRLPIDGSEKELIVINTHNSAYDSGGTLRKQQLDYLKNYMKERYEEGNYVVIGGDWNHLLPGITEDWFKTERPMPSWAMKMEADWALEGWNWGFDETIPTVRALDLPFERGRNFMTVIDGFLVSPNIEIDSVEGIDLDFVNSDHNPVKINISLK
jgi:endonuclease/exonuclease/phosphatase family metal-dependent hydrolase